VRILGTCMTNAFGTFIDTTERTHSAYEFNLNDTLIESIINRESISRNTTLLLDTVDSQTVRTDSQSFRA